MKHLLGIGLGIGVLTLASTPAMSEKWERASAGEGAVGSATAIVLHSVTSEPLAGVPVTVRFIVPGDGGTGGMQVFVTGRDGSALLTPLEDGTYEVYVDYNNQRSRSAFFTIDGFTDFHPVVTLRFNPDIDP